MSHIVVHCDLLFRNSPLTILNWMLIICNIGILMGKMIDKCRRHVLFLYFFQNNRFIDEMSVQGCCMAVSLWVCFDST